MLHSLLRDLQLPQVGVGVFYFLHANWVSSEMYSAPSIVLQTRTPQGTVHVFDDFREAYAWINYNTEPDCKVGPACLRINAALKHKLGSKQFRPLLVACSCCCYKVRATADCILICPGQVASWWDYGYQTTAMANRTVIVDNNTWNNTHIATVGRAMSSPEHKGWRIYRTLDVDYVFVVFGAFIGCVAKIYDLGIPLRPYCAAHVIADVGE